MDASEPGTAGFLSVRQRPWPVPLSRPRMCNSEDVRPGISLTDRYLLRDARPWIPVSGEMHYSRVPRGRWAGRLRRMRAGGLTIVAAYVPWIHHVEHRGQPRFDGNLDIGAFVDGCTATGLDVVLRIGPWVHGETRNGGFPDWVQAEPVAHRTDDPGYLALVREWFGQLGEALAGRCSTAGTVLAVQLENELYDRPGHIVTLKRLAREAGISAPIWTATAWGGAQLPPEEVLPLYGGYTEGFWVDAGLPWDPSFRAHFFFSHTWDDPGIGADVRRTLAAPGTGTPAGPVPTALFPPATCELGGGMATAYHRRPRPDPLDIATVAHCKLGNGSAWQGYYMYVGGTNPPGEHGLQESHATGYPNDLPRLGYDFHAPIGEAGTLSATHAHLRRQHAFLAAFGARLARLPSTLPDVQPTGAEDTTTLRWAVRSADDTGFLFLAWHQPHVPLDTYRGARFAITLDGERLLLPSQPVDVPPGTLARWPLGLTVAGVRLRWATASPLTVLPGEVPTLVLVAEPGIPVELALGPGSRADGGPVARPPAEGAVLPVAPGRRPLRLESPEGALDVLVLPAEDAGSVWVQEGAEAVQRRLLLSDEELAWGLGEDVEVVSSTPVPEASEYDPRSRSFRPLQLRLDGPPAAGTAAVASTLLHPAAPDVPAAYGAFGGRQSAPTRETFDQLAAVHRLHLPPWASDPGQDPLLHIRWAGDLAELRVDGRAVDDRFWDGSTWVVNLTDVGVAAGARITLHLLPLAAGSAVHLPADAAARLATSHDQLLALDEVRIEGRRTWHELRAAVGSATRESRRRSPGAGRLTSSDPPSVPLRSGSR